jgi:hypothetical protein
MSAAGSDCKQARLYIGAAPHELPPEIENHVAGCASCRRFLDETRALDGRVRNALEVPLARFRAAPAAPTRRFPLAASVVLALLVAGGVWLLRPPVALANEVMAHIQHEAGSWESRDLLPAPEIAAVLREAGVEIDTSIPVVYAAACVFRGRRVPHFVVRTAGGPVTVMLMRHEKLLMRRHFAESGLRGELIPVSGGSVALVTRGSEVPEGLAAEIAGGVRF